MKNIAMIKDGVVQNIAVWNGDQGWWDAVSQDFTLIDVTGMSVGVGDLYDGTNFSQAGN